MAEKQIGPDPNEYPPLRQTDGWTTLGELPEHCLFETNHGHYGIKMGGSTARGEVVCEWVGATFLSRHQPRDAAVRPIDLPFLLMCATDKLAESDAYARGVRDGKEAMRERAAQSLDNPKGDPVWDSPHPNVGAAIRALPLED